MSRAKMKFMLVMDAKMVRILRKLGKKRGIGLQEEIRAVVIPEWLAHQK